MPTQKKILNLNEVIKDSLPFLESRCKKEGIDLKIILYPKLPKIFADRSQMTQIILNLTQNSIQAMLKGGKLTISTTSTGKDILLIVEDTGAGIKEDFKNKFFFPFLQQKRRVKAQVLD